MKAGTQITGTLNVQPFTKTDLVVLMQVLNKAEKRGFAGDAAKRHLPRLIKKVDDLILDFIATEQNDNNDTEICAR